MPTLRIWFMIITALAFQIYLSMGCAGLAKPRKCFGKEIHILENDLARLEKIWEKLPRVFLLTAAGSRHGTCAGRGETWAGCSPDTSPHGVKRDTMTMCDFRYELPA